MYLIGDPSLGPLAFKNMQILIQEVEKGQDRQWSRFKIANDKDLRFSVFQSFAEKSLKSFTSFENILHMNIFSGLGWSLESHTNHPWNICIISVQFK